MRVSYYISIQTTTCRTTHLFFGWALLSVALLSTMGFAQQDDATKPPPAVGALPSINTDFLDPNLNVDHFVQRFELESREIFHARREILRACEIKPGWHIADIGAGTGVFSKLFAAETGDTGWVYALEISPRFIEHIRDELDTAGVRNVTPVLTSTRFARLPPASIQLAFVCDTYHHFEHPRDTLCSIWDALKPGGELVVIDFERIEGVSREWVLGHVRAGKAEFRAEIEQAGFEFVQEISISSFAENYMLRFRKPVQTRL